MGISETIIAAMIGALATVTTALFQLFTALRHRAKVDTRPKRGSTGRSVLAILALMVASAAGGFLYSEFIRQNEAEDVRALRHELRELKELTARLADGAAAAQRAPADVAAPEAAAASGESAGAPEPELEIDAAPWNVQRPPASAASLR